MKDPTDHERLVHDLEVHQAELESQNRELREAQQLLEESRGRFADLYDFAPIAYCTLDRGGVIREINLTGAALLGTERARLIGRSFAASVSMADRPAFRKHVADCLDSAGPCKVELTLSPTGRDSIDVEMTSLAAAGPNGNGTACRSALADITLRKKAEGALRLAVRMREEFLAVVSHDLRNPLSAITMATELLLRALPPEDRRRQGRGQLESIRRAAERMTRLVGDLLDLSSMDAGHLSMQCGLHDVRDIVNAAVEILQPMALDKHLRLETTPCDGPVNATCDRERITQVLLNLIGNAIKFTGAGGVIATSVTTGPDGVICSVRDTGKGIPPEVRSHIFDPYWQAQKDKPKGAGLGLSIAKGIVEFHGGRIWVNSEAGLGSTFYFTLPRTAPTPVDIHSREAPARPVSRRGVAHPEAAGQAEKRARAERRILVVDDEVDTRGCLEELLVSEGYEVACAGNGEEALTYLREAEEQPALVLLDLVMPVMDGWGFLREQQRDQRIARTPVVLISGQADAHQTAHHYHLAGFIQKPIGIANLFRALQEILS